MIKRQTLLFMCLLLLTCSFAYAQDATESAKKTSSSSAVVDKDIKNLKEKLEIYTESQKKDERAISGIAKVKDEIIIVKDEEEDKEYTIKIEDALTHFYQIIGSTKKEIKKGDIKSGDFLIVSGPVVDKTIQANAVYIDEAYIVASGKVFEVNKSDYYIKIITQDKEEIILDIESFTKQNILNIKTLEIEKIGFSKFKEGDTVHFTASKDDSSAGENSMPNRYAAEKILISPQEYFMK